MGTEQAKMFEGKYTVLELDTLKFMPDGALVTAYCVVENIPLTELAEVADLQKVHLNLLEKYRKKDWAHCEQSIKQLIGKWGGELDSFYTDLLNRVQNYQEKDPGENWDGFVEKYVKQ